METITIRGTFSYRAILITLVCTLTGVVHLHAQPLNEDAKRTLADTTRLPVPGRLLFITPSQDSAFNRIMSLPGSGEQKLEAVLKGDTAAVLALVDSLTNSPQERMRMNLALNSKDWQPTEMDKARREEEILRSQDFDYIFNGRRYAKLLSIPMSDIFTALGLKEDVTPRINYLVGNTQRVNVTIYSLSAIIVKVIVNGVQSPGSYKIVWDMTDDNGKRVPSGDYVAEVTVGGRFVLRKRIEVP